MANVVHRSHPRFPGLFQANTIRVRQSVLLCQCSRQDQFLVVLLKFISVNRIRSKFPGNAMDDYPWPNCSKKVWPLNDDIVISGIAGRFPESDNIDELAQNLLNNVDMVTRDERRWPIGLNNDQTSRSGKLKNLEYFDHTYFCTIPILADCMEPGSRIILETTYEAIADAGIAPQQIRGTKTGVYVGINTVANAEAIPQDDFSDIRAKDAAFWVYGSSKALLANRISFLFDLIGPSTVVDTACSASMVALANAVQDLRMGNCEMAVVATSNICLAPYSSYVYHSLGLLSPDGKCKVFDKHADGFVRSETVGALFLMRKTMAKRVYATVLHAKTNTDGFKTIGLFAPFWLRQRNLMIETFQEAGIQPGEVDYFESHGTGTNVGDPQESRAVSGAYGQNRKDKLLMGAVKSNLGHTEGASGLCSVAKAIIIFENRIIPANLHYTEPKPEIESLHKTIEPVVENQPFNGAIIGVNSFGVGGVNAHALLRINAKESSTDAFEIVHPIPRLILVCGRTIEAVEHIFDFVQNNPDRIHRDFLALLNDSMKTTCIKGSGNFPYRGYMIIDRMVKNGEGFGDENQFEYKNKTIDGAHASQPQQLWLVFTGMGSQWNGMAEQLMQISVFRAAIEHCAMVLLPMGVDLLSLLLENSAVSGDDVLSPVHSFVAITAMQIALYDVIEQLDLPIAGFIGHSFGEIACAYADGCLTASQAILTSYWRGKTVEDCHSHIPKGIMAAVGLTVKEFDELALYEEGVYVACHNGKDSITISGRTEPMQRFMQRLKAENVFCRKVMGGDYPYHSVWMQKMAPQLLEKLQTIIPEPKRRSVRWIATSIPPAEEQEEEEEGNDPKLEDAHFASGRYFVNNLLRPVYFEEAMQRVPKRSCCLEMAPHSLFQSIFKRCYPDHSYISLMKKDQPESNLINLLTSLGRIYTNGFNPRIEKLYPPVQWPVARGTQSIGALIRWDHSRQHEVKKYPDHHNFATSSNYTINVSLLDSDWRFIKHHRIDGRCVFPLTGYLWIVWRALATRVGQPWTLVAVRFENVRVCRPTFMNESKSVRFVVQILDQNGCFTLTENNALVCKGQVMASRDSSEQQQNFQRFQTEIQGDLFELEEEEPAKLNRKEIYQELKVRGYDYGQSFRWLLQADGQGRAGIVQWSGHWINFVDSALHLSLLSIPLRALFIPVQIDLLECDPRILFQEMAPNEVIGDHQKSSNSVQREIQSSASSKLKDGLDYFKDMTTAAASTTGATPTTNTSCGDETIPFEIMNFTFEPTTSLLMAEQQQKQQTAKTLYNVKFDLFNQTLITKGLLIQGLVPVNVPRKIGQDNLILERQIFAPLVDRKRFLPSFSLKNYAHSCTKLVGRFRRLLGFEDEEAEEDYDDAEKSSSTTIDEHLKYLKLLQNLCNAAPQTVPRDESPMGGWFQQAELELDITNQGLLYQEAFVRPIMELFAENVQHVPVVRILEICTHINPMAPTLIHHMKMNIAHKFPPVEYWLTKHERLLVPPLDSIADLVLKTIDWPEQHQQSQNATTSKASGGGGGLFRLLSEMFPEKFDLVIVSNRDDWALLLADGHDHDDRDDQDAGACIQVLANITKPSGFILSVTYNRTELLPFEQTLRDTLPLVQCRTNMIGAKQDTACNIDNNNSSSLPAGQSPDNSNNNIGWPSVNTDNNQQLHHHHQWNIDQYLLNDDGKQFAKIASNIDVEFAVQLSLYRKLNHYQPPEILLVPMDTHMVGDDHGGGHHFQWIEMLKDKIRWLKSAKQSDVDCRLWIVFDGSKHDPNTPDGGQHHHNGIVGFARCLLLELQPYRHLIRILALFDPDPDPSVPILLQDGRFNHDSALVREILQKDLLFNIYLGGELGTFRYLSIGQDDQDSTVQTDCAHVSQTQFGDLSSLKWFQSESFDDYLLTTTNHQSESEDINRKQQLLCNVYYSALNFKDVVIASGKILPGPESALFDCMIGLEFAGRCSQTGQRIMGMVPFKGMATKILTFKDFVWPVPDQWTMEDAATVPIVYVTAYYALRIRARLKPNEIVLIHSGAGGVGQAALNICLAMKCRVFVTVGTEAKRMFLKQTFNMDDDHILCSRDVQFEHHIKTLTNGYGCDVVLNSLTGDKLQASLRCLAVNGRFLEIGKWDMQMNSTVGMFTFLKNISFHGIGLDSLFREGLDSKCFREFFQEITHLIQDGIQTGVVRPICRTVFGMDQVEQAFRYMTNGHHIGKVLIQIRPEEDGTATMAPMHLEPPIRVGAIRKTWFNPYKVYLIAGGLGGVGLELIYWMIARGARKFMITTRSGIKSAYQRVFLGRFKIIEDFCPDYKIVFRVSTRNIADYHDCSQLVDETISDGQQLGGVFNLALVLQDGLFENQTIEAFENVARPKSQGLYNLHKICEERCLNLEHFVAFSSFTSGRGNVGQTNYGWANSAMERLIEARNSKDLPGLAIQFGPISDVGVVADQLLKSDLDQDSVKDDNRDGSLHHQFDEETLKSLLGISMQPIHSCLAILDQLLPRKQGVYSSYLKYEQNPNKSDADDEVIRQLCSHLNIDRRPEDECLGDIGLDSMAAVEIQQRLERDFSISLTLADVRQITVKELKNFRDGNRHNLRQYSDDIKRAKLNLSRLRFVIPTAPVVALNNVQKGKPIYCLPTLIGIFDLVTCLAKKMHRPLLGLNWTRQLNRMDTFEQIVDYYYELIINLIRTMRKQDENENGDVDDDDDDDDEHLETLAASTSSTSTSLSITCDILALDFGTLIALLIMLMKSKNRNKQQREPEQPEQQLKMNRLCCIDLLPLNQIMLERKKVEAQSNNNNKNNKNNNNSTTTRTTTAKRTEQQNRNIRSSSSMMMMIDEQILSDYKVMLIFDYIKLYIPERICHQSQREVLELNCCKARIDKINELLRKCLGNASAAPASTSTTNPECSSNVDMAEIIENTYRRASLMVDYQWKLSNGNTIRRLVLKVLNLNPNLRIDYVKFVDKSGGKFENPKSTEDSLRKQLKLMFDLDLDQYRNDPQLSKRFRLHLVDNHHHGHNDDLFARLDQNVVNILNDFC